MARGRKKKSEEELIEMYNQQKGYIEGLLDEDEEMVHCLDNESFRGRFYKPLWVATSKGRFYSLTDKRFLSVKQKATGKKNDNGKYTGTSYYYIGGKVCAHRMTANYFCDKRIVYLFGEENIEVHHVYPFDELKSLEENNCTDNLCYVPKPIHKKIFKNIYAGQLPEEFDTSLKWIVNTFAWHDDKTLKCTVSRENVPEIQFEIKISSKFFSKEEENLIDSHATLNPKVGFAQIRHAKRNKDGSVIIRYSNGESYCYIGTAGTYIPVGNN